MPTTASYTFVRTDKELQALAEEMRSFAERNILDRHQVQTLVLNEPGEREQHGPMTRIHGKEAGTLARRYSRFITFSAQKPRPLQISYIIYSATEKHGQIRQLTVSNNIKEQILVGDVSRIASFFLELDKPVHSMETPNHIALMLQGDIGGSSDGL